MRLEGRPKEPCTRSHGILRRRVRLWGAVLLGILCGGIPASGAALDPDRSAAEEVVARGMPLDGACLTPVLESSRSAPSTLPIPQRRAMRRIESGPSLPGLMEASPKPGLRLFYNPASAAFRRIPAADSDGDGLPDLLYAVTEGLETARRMLVEDLGFAPPANLDVYLVDVARGAGGYAVSAGGTARRDRIVLDPSSFMAAGELQAAAAHQLAHLVAAASGLRRPAQAEAFASWAEIRALRAIGPRRLRQLNETAATLASGLFSDSLQGAGGKALFWLFLEEAYGPPAIRAALAGLAYGAGTAPEALDAGLRPLLGLSLEEVVRTFHLWLLFTGSRDDGLHLSVAASLPDPSLAEQTDQLPVLSVRQAPALAPWGLSTIRIAPDRPVDGLAVALEGGDEGPWAADLVLVPRRGPVTRVAVPLAGSPPRGDATVPAGDLAEAFLLVRRLGPPDGDTASFSWSAREVPGYPAVFGDFHAEASASQVRVEWETLDEPDVVGFHVYRRRPWDERAARVDPVRVPALGGPGEGFRYQFLDLGAPDGGPWVYRVVAVTHLGLEAQGPEAPAEPPAPPTRTP